MRIKKIRIEPVTLPKPLPALTLHLARNLIPTPNLPLYPNLLRRATEVSVLLPTEQPEDPARWATMNRRHPVNSKPALQ
jgi:hypothetical protein